ncbi:MAG: CHAT domain-containing protein [Pyrinomonadaceae bacterium]|nr:CHAT domain-containing protein [Pyrinomonadaceae bacterium]
MTCANPRALLRAVAIALLIAHIVCAQTPKTTTPRAEAQAELDNFMATLMPAKTEEERRETLAARKDLTNLEAAKALMTRGERLVLHGEYAAALNLHKSALDIVTELKDEAGVALAINLIGRTRHAQNEYQAALELYEQSLALWTKLGGKEAEIADIFNDQARTYYALREYDKAQSHYEKAMKSAQGAGNKKAIAIALNGFGIIRYYRGDPKAALDFYQQSLRLCEEIGDKENGSNALNNIAQVYNMLGNFRQAIEFYEKSIRVYEELGAKKRVARSLANLANVYTTLNDHLMTIKVLQKSIAISEALDDKPNLAMAVHNTGRVYYKQGNYDLALHYFQKTLVLREAVGVKAQTINLLNSIGDVYRALGRYEQALEAHRKALSISEEINERRSIGFSFEGIGGVYEAQGNYPAALENFAKSLQIAEQMNNRPIIADSLVYIAVIYEAQGNYPKALEYADRAATLARELGLPNPLWRARTTAGQSHRALGHLAEARAAFEEAIRAIEDLRGLVAGGEREQQKFFADKLAPYTAMIELMLVEGNEQEAFAYAERAKARVLLDVLKSGRVEINKALTSAERKRERDLSGELTVLNEQVKREREREKPDAARFNELLVRQQKARLDYEAFQANIYAAHPELAVQRGEARTATLEELGALVPDEKTALVEFVVGEDRTLVFVITKSDKAQPQQIKSVPELHAYTLNIKRADLTKRIANFRQQLAARDLLFSVGAKELYQLLLAPAAAELQGRTRLILVPDGALWELPFQALLSPQNEYVVEWHALSYAPSLSVLGEMARRRKTRGTHQADKATLLAFGNPVLDAVRENVGRASNNQMMATANGRTFAALPEAERQVRALATLFGAGRSRVYTGKDALEEKLKREAGSYRIVHLATHGVLDDVSPLYSYILLNGSDNESNRPGAIKTSNGAPAAVREDGLLEAWELMQLNLHTDLVVLSACETARGRIGHGEGMIGLSWALFVAGSPTTVASQWKVESASTTELMLSFYRHLQSASGNASKAETKAEALRQASLSLLRSQRSAHPFYWAGFVIIGDGN